MPGTIILGQDSVSIKDCATVAEKVFSKIVPILFWGMVVGGLILPAVASR